MNTQPTPDLPPGAVALTESDWWSPFFAPRGEPLAPLDVECTWCCAPLGLPCHLWASPDAPALTDDDDQPTFHPERVGVRWEPDLVYDAEGTPVAVEPMKRPCGECFARYTDDLDPGAWGGGIEPSHWPDRIVVSTFTAQAGYDPTQAYRLQCGHSTIDL